MTAPLPSSADPALAARARELEKDLGTAHLAFLQGSPAPVLPLLEEVVFAPFQGGSMEPLRALVPWMTPAGRLTLVEFLCDNPVWRERPEMLTVASLALIETPASAAGATRIAETAARAGHTALFDLVRPIVVEADLVQSFRLSVDLLREPPCPSSTFRFLDALAQTVPLAEIERIPDEHLPRLPGVRARLVAEHLGEVLPASCAGPRHRM